ncbi:MAG TPA: DUF6088 family protein [Vicinamibacterales bacterium]|jgi:hypothetical protein|nr:DUF6088 family protein [Vicinamibacterales bacterium]
MDLKQQILDRIGDGAPAQVWTPVDFLDLGSRDAVDKALQRLAGSGQLRRIDRGLYDVPRTNALTRQTSAPDYRHVLDAVSRRDQTRMLVDGLTAANDLGLTTAVPAHIVVHTDARRRSIHVGRLVIDFKQTAPSKLYWAGRPAMRIVQALHWLPSDRDQIQAKLSALLADPTHGTALRHDLRQGLITLPAWMQAVLKPLLAEPAATRLSESRRRTKAPPHPTGATGSHPGGHS